MQDCAAGCACLGWTDYVVDTDQQQRVAVRVQEFLDHTRLVDRWNAGLHAGAPRTVDDYCRHLLAGE